MLVPSPKYNVEEIELSSYRYISVLRMSALKADDFDEYKCVSENTIGRSEAVMNVYGKTGSELLIACNFYVCFNASNIIVFAE